jgi:hypothetical protein
MRPSSSSSLQWNVNKMRPHQKIRTRIRLGLGIAGLLVGVSASVPALADDTVTMANDNDKAPSPQPSLGLAPGTPQVGALPGGLTPAYGQAATDQQDWRFDFHGFLTMPLRAGINKRSGVVTTDQHELVLHAPPVVPDYIDSFTYTSIVPNPYAQLNFSYGNSVVTGTAIVLAETAVTAQSFFNPPSEAGIADAYLTFRLPNLIKQSHFEINVGIFSNRYGIMGEYDLGRYGTPVIAQINGDGENIIGQFVLGKRFLLDIEQGIQGQIDKPPAGLLPAGWNGFASQNVGSGFANHVHAGLGYMGIATLGAHYITAWTQDDRASQGTTPDGSIGVLGADLRLSLNHFGHLYVAAAKTHAENSGSVGGIIQVLNTTGGSGLMSDYFGPNSSGTGSLMTFAGQYDLSIGRLLRYPYGFKGDGPDIVMSLFGMQTHVSSNDPAYDNVTKRKYGLESSYAILPWLAASLRLDRVEPDARDATQTFTVVSPRLIFRTSWQAHDQVVLQYSHWFDGAGVVVRNGYPAVPDPSIHPDEDVISLSASMWW